jgi:acetyl/propionyl-CoA carboxylase alpha subunit/acetyl-CoA carboxylase carboxyltransferase component
MSETAIPTIKPIRCLAIVNRGEAAMRCIRAVKSLRALEGQELHVVALYTAVDKAAPFVRHADLAVELPVKTTPVAAYLDHELLIQTLKSVGADAVWPGWGFVAESPDFVDKLTAEGIRFLGPRAETMRALGDKIASKLVAEAVDVPVTAWSGGEVKDVADAKRHADRIGYPVVIKASAGGGGRGIRIVRSPEVFEALFTSAQSEAISAFGDGRMFVEAMVQGGRHIEVQIVADQHGTTLAFGCRDCSVQRRHQKVLEEAPPVGLPPLMLQALKESAVALAKHVKYQGAGTVEFLVKGADYFFLEMNPRLQVEHGITEEITGTDLVQLQIRVARGEKLPDTAPRERGFSIEARVCAEDPDAGFLPAPGRIARFDPALGRQLRIDTGVASESTVPAAFDSLIAKVIASGDTREEACARLATALRDFDLVIEGGATNKGYLLELLDAEEFKKGGVDTLWLDRWNEKRVRTTQYAGEALMLAAILSYRAARATQRSNFYSDVGNITQDKIPKSSGLEFDLNYDGKQYRAHVYATGAARYRVHFEGRVIGCRLSVSGGHAARLVVAGQDLRVLYDMTDTSIRVEVEGIVHRFGRQTAGQVRANAPSMVVSLNVQVGSRVNAGDSLGLLEAMKMEIGFDAPVSGVVTEIRVKKGQQVAAGDVILVIDPANEEEEAASVRRPVIVPTEVDSLALLFTDDNGLLGQPNLAGFITAPEADRAKTMAAVRDELRRTVLGYDTFKPRVERLIALFESPLPENIPADVAQQLSQIREQVMVFVDVERLFLRSTRRRLGTGELDQLSNNALMRLFVRRMRAEGEGLSEPFLKVLKRGLSHYDEVVGLEYGGNLERAVVRMFATQLESKLRARLVQAVLRHLIALSAAGVSFEGDQEFRDALADVASMRGHLPQTLSDLAIEARYSIYQRPELERAAEQTTRQVENWLAQEGFNMASPPDLSDLALAPRGLFNKVYGWLSDSNTRRRSLALAASVRRAYAPLEASEYSSEANGVEALTFPDRGRVLACVEAAERVVERLKAMSRTEGARPFAIEVFVPVVSVDEEQGCTSGVEAAFRELLPASRVTLTFLYPSSKVEHETFAVENGKVRRLPLYRMHPEAAWRLDLHRYASFELERLESEEGIFCFAGKAREVPDDERIFVLAEVRGRPRERRPLASNYVPLFERVLNETARTLRWAIAMRDPRRRLQWNRVTIFVAHPVVIEPSLIETLSQQLYPVTRHLGLERVAIRLKVLESETSAEFRDVEVVVSDRTGSRMEIVWREPHTNPLIPVTAYERSVVTARMRGLIYPYEIINMLAPQSRESIPPVSDSSHPIPPGEFEEYDLDLNASQPVAVSVKGRAPGKNASAIVFGVITTPTTKVPEGMKRVLVLSDPTRGMGALAAGECDRITAAIDLAEKMQVPVEWLPVSSGARIAMDSGTENLDATARVVRRIVTFTQSGGVIHLIVAGINVGAQSYWNSLATMLNHTKGALIMTPTASMVLTGRAALAASGSVSAEDEVAIGGYERVMGPNGQAQYYAEDLGDAYRILYQHYDYTYVCPGEKRPRRAPTTDLVSRNVCEFSYSAGPEFSRLGEIFDPTANPGRKKPFSMRALMSGVADVDSGHLERWQAQVGGETAIVWDTHIGGYPVCLVGIESQNVARWGYRPFDGPADWNGGTLFPISSKKLARALNASSGNRPTVILANLSGFDGSPESMRKLQLEYGAEIARAVVNYDGPIVFLVVSRYHGGAYVVFSRELSPNLRAAALEGSFASVIGGGPAAAVVFPREVGARVNKDPRVIQIREQLHSSNRQEREAAERVLEEVRLAKQAEVAAEFDHIHSVERAKRVGSLEAIIAADKMRDFIVSCIQ